MNDRSSFLPGGAVCPPLAGLIIGHGAPGRKFKHFVNRIHFLWWAILFLHFIYFSCYPQTVRKKRELKTGALLPVLPAGKRRREVLRGGYRGKADPRRQRSEGVTPQEGGEREGGPGEGGPPRRARAGMAPIRGEQRCGGRARGGEGRGEGVAPWRGAHGSEAQWGSIYQERKRPGGKGLPGGAEPREEHAPG